jgi:hypothetical protein
MTGEEAGRKAAYDKTRFCFRCEHRIYDMCAFDWYCEEARKLRESGEVKE